MPGIGPDAREIPYGPAGVRAVFKERLRRCPPPPPPPRRMSDERMRGVLAREGRSRVLDVGSGAWRRAPTVVNLDVEPHPNVDVVGDAQALPFRSEVFDVVCCSSTLEHLHFPHRVIREIRRVLRPGGKVFVEAPFVYPFHGDDATGEKDYRRMTAAGLRHALSDFSEIESGLSVGPGSVLSLVVAEFLALFFSGKRHTALYYGVRNLAGWILLPLHRLDPWLSRRRFSHRIAGGFYFLGVKDEARQAAP